MFHLLKIFLVLTASLTLGRALKKQAGERITIQERLKEYFATEYKLSINLPTPSYSIANHPFEHLLVNGSLSGKSSVFNVHNVASEEVKKGLELGTHSFPKFLAQFKKPVIKTHKDVLAGDGSFTCSRLPAAYDPYTVCSGVVDYDFYTTGLNETLALEGMNDIAKDFGKQLNNFINAPCLGDMKRWICAQVYLPCVPGVVPGNTSTYMEVPLYPGGPVDALPYQRPCGSVCTAISYTGTSCAGLLEILGFPINCTTNYPGIARDVNDIATFDFTSTPRSMATNQTTRGVCNDLESSIGLALVAEPVEPYIGEMCKGAITEVITIAQDERLTPLLGPYVSQTIAELTVAYTQNLIPRYLYQSCLTAEHHYMCGVNFWGATRIEYLDFIYGGPVYVPSFPEHASCTNFERECSASLEEPEKLSLIDLAPDFKPNCSTDLGGGVKFFPNITQIIGVVDLGPNGIILLYTEPLRFLLNSTLTAIDSQCPWAYDHVDDVKLTKLNGLPVPTIATDCYGACPHPSYAPRVSQELIVNTWLCYVSLVVFCFLAAFNILLLPPKKRNIYLFAILLGYGLKYLIPTILLIVVTQTQDIANMQCNSGTSWHSYSARYESSIGMTIAIVSVVSNIYHYFLNRALLSIMATELLLRICFGVKNILGYQKYYIAVIYLFYSVFFFLICTYKDASSEPAYLNNDPGSPFRLELGYLVSSNDATTQNFFYNPSLVANTYILGCMLAASVTVIRLSFAVNNKKVDLVAKLWKSYNMLFVVLGIYSIFFFLESWAILYVTPQYENGELKALDRWYTCMFTVFTNEASADYSSCGGEIIHGQEIGIHKGLYSNTFPIWMILVVEVCGMIGVVGLLFMTVNKEVKAAYRDSAIRVMEVLGIIHLLRMVLTSEEWQVYLVSATKKRTQVSGISSTFTSAKSSGANSSVNSSITSEVEFDELENDETVKEGDELDEESPIADAIIRAKPASDAEKAAAYSLASVVDTYAVGTVKNLMQDKVDRKDGSRGDEKDVDGDAVYHIPTAEALDK
jgi:hypothetical protein